MRETGLQIEYLRFWNALGVLPYLLIGFYFRKPDAASAGKKAFIVTRIGDFGFLIALLLLYRAFNSLDYSQVLPGAARFPDRIFRTAAAAAVKTAVAAVPVSIISISTTSTSTTGTMRCVPFSSRTTGATISSGIGQVTTTTSTTICSSCISCTAA